MPSLHDGRALVVVRALEVNAKPENQRDQIEIAALDRAVSLRFTVEEARDVAAQLIYRAAEFDYAEALKALGVSLDRLMRGEAIDD